MQDLQDKEALKEKIEKYLSSKDKEMIKLGRVLCHAHRIDYYVLMFRPTRVLRENAGKILHFSIFPITVNNAFSSNNSFGVYHIKLPKDGRKRRTEEKDRAIL